MCPSPYLHAFLGSGRFSQQRRHSVLLDCVEDESGNNGRSPRALHSGNRFVVDGHMMLASAGASFASQAPSTRVSTGRPTSSSAAPRRGAAGPVHLSACGMRSLCCWPPTVGTPTPAARSPLVHSDVRLSPAQRPRGDRGRSLRRWRRAAAAHPELAPADPAPEAGA